jgi:hypothetical protein
VDKMNKLTTFVPFLLLAVGCGASQEQLVDRASLDLRCPRDQLQVKQVDQRTQAVRGCGHQVAYIESCDTHNVCTWILNSDSFAAQPAQPSQPQRVCIPNDTKECLGPGACKGAQACREDGASYTPCDCGPPAVAAP